MRALLLISCCLIALGAVPLKDDAPIPPPKKGDVTGTIAPAAKVQRLRLISRQTGKAYAADAFDTKTGTFAFRGLPGDATYDLQIRTTDGREIEGVDLSRLEAQLHRLAEQRRKDLGATSRPATEFAKADADAIAKFVADWVDFMDTNRLLYVCGHGETATALVELMRLKDFHAGTGQVIWRVELWYFRKAGGGWERVPNVERVLRRKRCSPDDLKAVSVTYYPELSVYVDRQGKADPVAFTLPAKENASCGRPAGSETKLKTRPHVVTRRCPE